MTKLISMCGLLCSECPAYIATQKNDDAQRAKVASEWTEGYKVNLKAEDINCDGCVADGKKFSYLNICQIRKCGTEKSMQNCSYCNEYVCEKLDEFFKFAPQAKETFDSLKKGN
jgi:hypothetical protein